MKQSSLKNKILHFVKKHDVVFMSFIFNSIILFIMLLFFEPTYFPYDDVAMCNLVDGSKGAYDPHLIFINCVIGYLLKWLYMTFSVVPWYTVLQYVIIFVSQMVLTHIMWRRMPAAYCRCAFLALLIFVSYHNYILLQFSRTATIATIAGVLALLNGFFEKKLSVKWLAFGYLLALVGSWYRIMQFMVVTALLSGIGLYYFLCLIKKEKHWRRYLVQNIGVFAILFVLVFGFYYWDQQQYASQEWQDYKKFNTLRSELWDYGFPDYQKYQKEYNDLGLDDITVSLFQRWQSLDPDRLTIDVFQKLVDLKDPKKIDGEFWKGFAKAMFFNIYQIPAFFLAVFSVILWLVFNKRSRIETITVIYEICMIILIYIYLYYQGRYFKDRVDMGLWLSVALVVFWLLEKKNAAFSLQAGVVTCSILVIVSLYFAYPRFKANLNYDDKKAKCEQIEELGQDKEHLYLTKILCVRVETGYGPLDRLPENVIANLCPMGGWTSRSASDNAILKQYDIRNPYKDMINNEKVYLVDNDIKTTIAYIQKWYSPDAKAEKVKEIVGCPVYKIVEKQEEKKSDKKSVADEET